MCGFAGIVMLDGGRVDPQTLNRMTAVIRHRGPDETGFRVAGPVGFGFQRLSILDLSANGHQPMVTPDGSVAIVFNGEIYNYRELRRDLEARGHTFRSDGDTEVLLHAYCEWGTDCLAKLNGMWAFLIHDARRGTVFGSRDRFGEKPLFYARATDRVLFASEVKSIRASGCFGADLDAPVVADYFLGGMIDVPRASHATLYRDILQLPPAHAFELRLEGAMRIWRYWAIEEGGTSPARDPVGEFADLFEQSVRLRLRSDVPVGVFLSGGMDSTSIICAMARQMDGVGTGDRTLRAFCFHAEGFDETRYIADTLRQTGAEHTILRAGPHDLWNVLDRFFWHHEEPVHSIVAVVGFKLMELAASHGVKVVLNGQGADETLAGYPANFPEYWHTLLERCQVGRAWREIGDYARGRGAPRGRLFLRAVSRVVKIRLRSLAWYRSLSSRRNLQRAMADPWYTRDLKKHFHPEATRVPVAGIRHALQGEIHRSPLPLFLRVEDRNSMAHSVEGRLPFLDHRLVELAFRTGDEWFMRGMWNKVLLRESMQGRIPESVRTRVDKMGFPTPMAQWLRGPLYEPVREIVTSREFRERGIYHADVVARDLERHRQGEIDVSDRLWDVIQWEKVVRVAASDPAPIAPEASSASP